jgi:hypothetical protein
MKNGTLLAVTLFTATMASLVASEAHAGTRGTYFATGGMALTNSSQQGGKGPSGSTLLTHTDLFYNWDWYAFGGFLQYDKQGASETDLNVGPKFDFNSGPFYMDVGYAVLAQRAYTDRSIAKQTGAGWLFGAGVRVPLGQSSSGINGWFLQFSYKYRMLTIKKQDGALISQPITQKDGYPVFGLGMQF